MSWQVFKDDTRSNEAGLKYFLLGAFSTGFLLYGMALLYGVTGTTNISEIGLILSSQHQAMLGNPMTIAGMLLLSTGFLFKIGVVPFHMWARMFTRGSDSHHSFYERWSEGCCTCRIYADPALLFC